METNMKHVRWGLLAAGLFLSPAAMGQGTGEPPPAARAAKIYAHALLDEVLAKQALVEEMADGLRTLQRRIMELEAAQPPRIGGTGTPPPAPPPPPPPSAQGE